MAAQAAYAANAGLMRGYLMNCIKKMSYDAALSIVGNRAKWELLAIKKALSMHQWLNTPAENERLIAVKIVLRGYHVKK